MRPDKKNLFLLSLLGLAALVSGCSATVGTFETPATVNEALLKDADTDIVGEFAKKPAARFPAYIAVVRLAGDEQRDEQRSYYRRGYFGAGAIDVGESAKSTKVVEAVGAQAGVAGAGSLNSFLVSSRIENDGVMKAVRLAAAKVHTDMALIYTINSGCSVRDQSVLLSICTLGLAPLQKVGATASVTAVLVDVRTGYIYGVLSAGAEAEERSIGWLSRARSASLRSETEDVVVDKFVAAIPKSWEGVKARYADPGPAPAVTK